jgi:hypothetical protein
VIKKILMHLGFWELKVRPAPKVKLSSIAIPVDDWDFQGPFLALSFYPDTDYPMDSSEFQNRVG